MNRAAVGAVVLALVGASAARGATPTVSAAARPAEPLFGDSFSYIVDVTVATASADRARIVDDVGPFTRVAPTRTNRSVSGGTTRITLTETLACLAASCIPPSPGKSVVLPPARVVVARTAGAKAAAVAVAVGLRVPAAEVKASKPEFRHPETLPSASFRLEPLLAEALLVAMGIILLAAGLLAFASPFRRRRSSPAANGCIDPVERAARLLRESETREVSDRRRAAGLASRVVGEPELAFDAARIAWSRRDPGPPDAATLANRLDQTPDGGA